MAKERTCMICGTTYRFCNHCQDYQREPGWRVIYHDEICKRIGDVWYAYRGKEISKEEARVAMSVFKPNIDNALKFDGTVAAKEIKEIFDVKEDAVEQQSKNENKEEVPVIEKHTRKRSFKKENQESE